MQILDEIDNVLDQKMVIDPTKLAMYIRILKVINLLMTEVFLFFYLMALGSINTLLFFGWNRIGLLINSIIVFLVYLFYLKKAYDDLQHHKKEIRSGIKFLQDQKIRLKEKNRS